MESKPHILEALKANPTLLTNLQTNLIEAAGAGINVAITYSDSYGVSLSTSVYWAEPDADGDDK